VALDVADLLPKLVGILDEPIGDPGAITTLLMCEAARESGAKVLLSGMGADELFAGHRRYVTCVMAERYNRLPGFARQAVGALVGRLPAGTPGRGFKPARWAKRVVALSELPEEAAFRSTYSLYDPLELAALVSPELGPDVDDVMEEHLEVYCDNYLSDHVNRMCLADVRLFLPGLKLTYTDRASMATSTEIRYPFIDPVVFRAAFALTGQHKVRNMSRKVMLKQAARAWLPDEVVHHPRAHHSAPLRDWVADDLRGTVDDVLLQGQLVSTGFLHADAVSKLVGEDRAGLQDHSQQIWQLLTLEYWYRQACEAGVGL
jgi:asparagine synthase (glutamine-hydrolysing)